MRELYTVRVFVGTSCITANACGFYEGVRNYA